MNCLQCDKLLSGRQKKFCTLSCSASSKTNAESSSYIARWKLGQEKGYSGKLNEVSGYIRNYLLSLKGQACWKCNWSEVNPVTGKVPLQLNHVDGDSTNCKEMNLEFICPNCHSLTPNFGALNKGNGKRKR